MFENEHLYNSFSASSSCVHILFAPPQKKTKKKINKRTSTQSCLFLKAMTLQIKTILIKHKIDKKNLFL